MWFSQEECERYSLKKGDLLVVEGGDVSSCDYIDKDLEKVFFQNALHRARAKKEDLSRFLRYWLITARSTGYIDLLCNKATIAHFTKDKFSSLPYPVLSTDEQCRIVTHLDRKCAQIDALIANVQAQIEKLKQYKQSVITEVVTKGLDPSVPMKDSGVEWIGEIPAHWHISRVGQHCNIILGKMLCSDQLDQSYTLEPYYCAANIHFEGIDTAVSKEMWFSPRVCF